MILEIVPSVTLKKFTIMFFLEYDHGYVVTVMFYLDGFRRELPLRKFFHQGDALIFRDEDCPKLGESQIKYLIKMYDPSILYHRVDARHFTKLSAL